MAGDPVAVPKLLGPEGFTCGSPANASVGLPDIRTSEGKLPRMAGDEVSEGNDVHPPARPQLRRRLGVFDSVMIGLGSMIGAGIFAALGPAASAAGGALLVGLAVAAVIAYCNAHSSARLAALYPQSGGTYVYGRERLGPCLLYTSPSPRD